MDPNGDGAAKNKNQTEKQTVSLAEAAAKLDPSDLAEYLNVRTAPELELHEFYCFFDKAFTKVSWKWVKMFNESPLSMLIDVPLSHIPKPVYEVSVDWIKRRHVQFLSEIVMWAYDCILVNLAGLPFWTETVAPHFVVLALVLRARPDSLIKVLPSLRDKPTYHGPNKLPLVVWMMAQASRGDLSIGLYSWMCNLLPLVSNNKSCPDLILQLVEYILSRPEALTVLVNGGGVMEGERLISVPSLEILLHLTFPAPSARVETTKRFEVIYPMLKEVALSPKRAGGRYGMKHTFTFALLLAGEEGDPVLAEEATSIAIRSLSENIDCFEHWDKLYTNNPEASVALLKKLVDEWNNHFLRLSSSSLSDTLTVHQTMESFRLENKKAIAKGGAKCSLYKEADKYCRLISGRLSPLSGGLTHIIAAVVVTVAGSVLGAATILCSL